MTKIEKLITQEYDWLIAKIKQFVAIKSFYQKDKSTFPFGQKVQDALVFAINEFKNLNLKTFIDPAGYYGYAEIGDSPGMFGILAHVDVVPVGDLSKWIIQDPFKAEIVNNIFYGRGVIDDKGPIIAMLLALKLLLAQNYQFKQRIRFIFGTDEESLWRGINKYMAHEEQPLFGLVTDADFPLVYAEKGLLNLELKGVCKLLPNLKWGQAFNAVIDQASYGGSDLDEVANELKKLNYPFAKRENTLIVEGKGAHAKNPQLGINAAMRLLQAFYNLKKRESWSDFLIQEIADDPNAKNIFNNLADPETGPITLNVGKITIKDQQVTISIDIRYPVIDCNKKQVLELITNKAKHYNLTVSEYDYLPPVYLAPRHRLVKMLHQTYMQITGDIKSKLVATGGATYARAMPNCVSFGPKMPHDISNEHGPNEQFNIISLKKAVAIYYQTLKNLNEFGFKFEK